MGCRHTETTTNRVDGEAATCGADGYYYMVTTCNACGAETGRETVTIPATGDHRSASTDYTEGKATCTVCGNAYDKYVNVLWDKYLFATDMTSGFQNIADASITDNGAKFVGSVAGKAADLGNGNVVGNSEELAGDHHGCKEECEHCVLTLELKTSKYKRGDNSDHKRKEC